MEIEYKINQKITVEEAIGLYNRSTLGERRPVNHPDIFDKMLKNSNLTITAWDKKLNSNSFYKSLLIACRRHEDRMKIA